MMPGEALSGADVLVFVALAVGLLMIPVGLPGLWVILGAAVLHRAAGRSDELGIGMLALLAALALVAELVEAGLGVAAARRFGASRWGMWGAFLGGIAGALVLTPFFPLAGTLFGAFLGAFAGAFGLELWKSRTFRSSWRAGLGAFAGRVAAVAVKVAIGVTMAVLIVWKIG